MSCLIRTHRTHVGLRDDFPFLNVRTYICHHIKCYYRTVFLSLSLFDSVNQVLVVLFIVVVLPLYSFDLSLYLRNILIERGNKTMNYKRRIYNFCHHLIFVLFFFKIAWLGYLQPINQQVQGVRRVRKIIFSFLMAVKSPSKRNGGCCWCCCRSEMAISLSLSLFYLFYFQDCKLWCWRVMGSQVWNIFLNSIAPFFIYGGSDRITDVCDLWGLPLIRDLLEKGLLYKIGLWRRCKWIRRGVLHVHGLAFCVCDGFDNARPFGPASRHFWRMSAAFLFPFVYFCTESAFCLLLCV